MDTTEKDISGLGDAMGLVVEYVKQETLAPLKGIGRFLAFGISAAIFFGIGSLLLLLALLRALQTQTGSTFTGHLSWAPYLLTLVVAVVIAACAGASIGRTKRLLLKRKQSS